MTGALHSRTQALSSTTVIVEDAPDPRSLIPASGGLAWLSEALCLIGEGPVLSIDPGTGPERFRRGAEMVATLLEGAEIADEVDLPGSGPVVFGSWTFDEESAGSRLIVPSTVYGFGEGLAWKTMVTFIDPPAEEPFEERRNGGGLSPQDYIGAVGEAVAAINSGRVDKVVLARKTEVEAAQDIHEGELAGRLFDTYPGCFVFCFEHLVGASPELLVRRVDDLVDSVPLAGSTRRGSSPGEDAALGRRLQESHKNRAEHALAVETVVDKLSPWCSEFFREPEPALLLLANLQHLSTKIQGKLAGSPTALILAGALHPTAAVCGVPEKGALQMIRELEHLDRGRYSGPIGWFNHRGDGEWAIALRCARIKGRTAELYAGAGIVAESDPVDELEETTLKLLAVLDTLP
ncbi:chorismate-binding protein [soil metagenome]